MLELTVPPTGAGHRLDRFLAGELSHLSRARVQALIRGGHVRLNQRTAKPSESLRPADVISWEEPPAAETALVAEAHRSGGALRGRRPARARQGGGHGHPPRAGQRRGHAGQRVLAHCPTLSGIGGERRPGIVHRLDKDTTGCLVVAKNDLAHRALAAQFAARTTQKTYLALARGVPRPATGTIDAPVGRHPVQRKKMAVVPPPRGRSARTDYRVRKTFALHKTVAQESDVTAHPYIVAVAPLTTQKAGGDLVVSLLECRIHTGRTHQIRVHLKHLGYPILGDPLYRRPQNGGPPDAPRLEARLHASPHGAADGILRPAARGFPRFRTRPRRAMSRFHAALNFVLSELDHRRQTGYGDWRAAARAVQRLEAARPQGVVTAAASAPPPPGPADVQEAFDSPPMPKSRADDETPALFGGGRRGSRRGVPLQGGEVARRGGARRLRTRD